MHNAYASVIRTSSRDRSSECICYLCQRIRARILCILHTYLMYKYKKEVGYEDRYYIHVDILCVVAVDVVNSRVAKRWEY